MERILIIKLIAAADEVGPVGKTDLRLESKFDPPLSAGTPSFLEGLLHRIKTVLSLNALSTDECKHEFAREIHSAPDNFYSYKGICAQCGIKVKSGWTPE